MNRYLTASALASMNLSLAQPAMATAFSCPPEQVQAVGQGHGGDVYLRMSFGTINVCSTAYSSGAISPDTCRGWLSQFFTSRAMGRPVGLWFDTSEPSNSGLTVGQCTSANFNAGGNWASHRPYYIETGF
jgi:hypothetical protein